MSFLGKIAYQTFPERLFSALRVLRDPSLLVPFDDISYNQDRLLTSHNSDFMRSERFSKAYRKGKETGSWGKADIHWRAYVICWAAEIASSLPGDFVECGVNRGGYSRTLVEFLNFGARKARTLYLLDTFNGLVEEYISDEERQHGIHGLQYQECYDAVKATFEDFDNVKIIKGVVPESLPQVNSETICFLSIDMNCAQPEIDAAEFFWDKLVEGAIVVLDDYGWSEHINQKLAFDDFAKRKNTQILSLPTGQGIIIKQLR